MRARRVPRGSSEEPTADAVAVELPTHELLSPEPELRIDPLWDVLSLAGVATCLVARDATIAWCNAAFAGLLERESTDLEHRRFFDVLNAGPQDALDRALRKVVTDRELLPRFEVAAVDSRGTHRALALSGAVTTVWNGEEHLLIVAEDLTPERQSARVGASTLIEDSRMANQDMLTGVANRDGLEALLSSSLQRASRTGTAFAVLLCNLDDFARVNEELGNAAGDEILQWVATRLTHTLRHHDVLARLGGDEFVVIAETVPDEKTAMLVAHRLIAAISEPINVSGRAVRIGMSVGLTIAAGHERTTDVIANADQAVHAAKRSSKGGVMTYSQTLEAVPRQGVDANDLNGLTEFTGIPEIRRGRHFRSTKPVEATELIEAAAPVEPVDIH